MSALQVVPSEWMTAVEIAAADLVGMPSTESAVIRMARREGWRDSGYARRRDGRGGGWEYNAILLPEEARADLLQKIEAARIAGTGTALALPADRDKPSTQNASRLTARQRAIMDGRSALLTAIDTLVAGGFSQGRAIDQIVDQVADRSAPEAVLIAADAASERTGPPSRSNLYRWLRARQAHGISGLAPRLKRQRDDLPPWFDDWLRFYALPTKPRMAEALDAYRRSLADPSDAPTYAQVRRALSKLAPLERLKGREGKLAMRNRLAYVARDTSDLMPTAVYAGDGKTFAAEIAHPKSGQPFRPEITTFIDARTRVLVGWSADLSERFSGVSEAFRHACADFGIPAICYTDNGPGYTSKAMVALYGRVGTTHMTALPYNSQAKGIVERLNQIYTPLAKSFPTYLGADMDKEAKQLVHKKTRRELAEFGTSRTLPTWRDFVDRMRETVEAYNNRPHSALPLMTVGGRRRRMTPLEAWHAAKADGFEPIVPAADEIDDMFRPWEARIARRGLVELFSNEYFLPALEAHDGMQVAVGYDSQDASKVIIRTLDRTDAGLEPGALIGVGVFGGNRTRFVPVSAERDAAEKRAKGRLRRLGKKADAVRQELDPFDTFDQTPRAGDTILNVRVPIANDLAAAVAAPGERPVFTDDASFAQWALANRDALTDGDRRLLRELISNAGSRDMLSAFGVDPHDIRALLRAQETTRTGEAQ